MERGHCPFLDPVGRDTLPPSAPLAPQIDPSRKNLTNPALCPPPRQIPGYAYALATQSAAVMETGL